MNEQKEQKRKLIPTETHFIALPLFLLGVFVSYRHYSDPESTETLTYILLMPVVVGAIPYLALLLVYSISLAALFIGILKYMVLNKIKDYWRN